MEIIAENDRYYYIMRPKNSKRARNLKKIKREIRDKQDLFKQALEMLELELVQKYKNSILPEADPLTLDDLDRYSRLVSSNSDRSADNALSALPVSWLAENREYLKKVNYAYSHLPDYCPRPTQQANSGRCWIFAALNTLRYRLIKNFNLNDKFELSEAFLFFYDRLERSLYLLEKILELRKKPLSNNIVCGLLAPISDGGTWSYFVNLIKKYGIVPKSCYGETFNSNDTTEMNEILYEKLAQYITQIRTSRDKRSVIQKRIREEYMPEVYRLVSKFMGVPPKVFDWSFHEAGETFEGERTRGRYIVIKDLTPMDFYIRYIEIDADLDNKVLLRHDPRLPYYQTYAPEHSGAMISGGQDVAFNVPWEVLSKVTKTAVLDGNQLWFSADVRKCANYEYGLLSTEAFDYETVLGTSLEATKADRLSTRVSMPVHAMAIIGVDLADGSIPLKWKVENSWGDNAFGGDDPGYLQMTEEWFKNYGYEVVVDTKYLDKSLLDIYLEKKYSPTLLPYNDVFNMSARHTKEY